MMKVTWKTVLYRPTIPQLMMDVTTKRATDDDYVALDRSAWNRSAVILLLLSAAAVVSVVAIGDPVGGHP
jgi:hypothetical protein